MQFKREIKLFQTKVCENQKIIGQNANQSKAKLCALTLDRLRDDGFLVRWTVPSLPLLIERESIGLVRKIKFSGNILSIPSSSGLELELIVACGYELCVLCDCSR